MKDTRGASGVAVFLAALICVSSSWDVFLTIQAGATFRICQLATLPLLVLAVLRVIRSGMLPTLGMGAALSWLLLQISFIPATEFWPRSVGYCLWLALDLALVFSFVQLFGSSWDRGAALLRWYVRSFVAVAAFGISQFFLSVCGLGAPLVQQWWIQGVLPRVNGFSYEPSYFATYMLIGYVFITGLRETEFNIVSSYTLRIASVLCAIAIFISSSRMGIVFLACELLFPPLKLVASLGLNLAKGRIVRPAIRPALLSIVGLFAVATTGVAGVSILSRNPEVLLLFLNGTGISDTAAHSIVQRENAFGDTLSVFVDHPFVGRSLGGVASAIAELHGETITSFEEAKQFEGMSTFAEVLAASGVLGIIPFVWLAVTLIYQPIRVIRSGDPVAAGVLKACVRSLLYAVAILQFNQNILRPYLWVHIAILASTYAISRQASESGGVRFPNTRGPGTQPA